MITVGEVDSTLYDINGNPLGTQKNPLITQLPDNSYDSFSRIRVSSPETIFDSKFPYFDSGDLATTKQTLFWNESVSGTGRIAHSGDVIGNGGLGINQASIILQTNGTASGATAIRQTKEYFNYQPGKAHLILTTFVLGAIKSNVSSKVGYFDSNNGIFLEMAGTQYQIVLRTDVSGSIVNTAIARNSWTYNGVADAFDGSGPSGINLDFTKIQLMVIDFAWLGSGKIRIGFVLDGAIYYVHSFEYSNLQPTPHLRTPNLPVRYEITNTGTAASSTNLTHVCSTVISEGGYNIRGSVKSFKRNTALVNVSGTVTALMPIMSIRLKPNFNRCIVIPESISVMVDSLDSIGVDLILNGTLTGASFVNYANSIVQTEVTSTAITGGISIMSEVSSSQNRNVFAVSRNNPLRLVSNIAGTSDILTLCANSFSGTTATVAGAMSWRELI